MEIQYTVAKTDADLEGILRLQRANLPGFITSAEALTEGFVTVEHNLELLRTMQEPYPHIIALVDQEIIGYALVMLPALRNQIPILVPMFEQIDQIHIGGVSFHQIRYCVMGQICIAKEYRGKGIFAGLYQEMRQELQNDFDMIVTEVSRRNPRSLRAHAKVGFIELKSYCADNGEHWAIIGLPTQPTISL